MKGLLIKDFKLMKIQKNFFITLITIAIGLACFYEETTFIIGYLTIICSLFTISTISYDEYDNGNAFLFTLPITRKGYVIEKYCFGIIMGLLSLLTSTILCLITEFFKKGISSEEILLIPPFILASLFIIIAIAIPYQIKFGAEKGRIAIMLTMGVIIVIGIVVIKITELLNFDLASILNQLSNLGIWMLAGIFILCSIILLIISAKICISIMNKKEL